MVQKWPEINGRQFVHSDGALELGEEEEDFRKYEKEREGREGIINHESRCDSDSMCTIRRHLTADPTRSLSDRVTTSETSVGQMMRVACSGTDNRSISFVGFECRSVEGTIFWRFL